MAAPAMKLTMVIESAADNTLVPRIIPLLTEMSLQQVLDQDFVQALLGPLMERHWAALELIKQRATVKDGVITFDITDQPTEGYNKFIPYYLYPEATYNVGLSKSSFRTKVSVGTNPWTSRAPSELVNLAEICERYGGGGHARVGAISFPPDREDEAREAVGGIVAELRDR
jgi:c-di-AMP phosphodiesterase-like protein